MSTTDTRADSPPVPSAGRARAPAGQVPAAVWPAS